MCRGQILSDDGAAAAMVVMAVGLSWNLEVRAAGAAAAAAAAAVRLLLFAS